MRGSRRHRTIVTGKVLLLVALGGVTIVAIAQLGSEHVWFAPLAVAIAVLFGVVFVGIGKRQKHPAR